MSTFQSRVSSCVSMDAHVLTNAHPEQKSEGVSRAFLRPFSWRADCDDDVNMSHKTVQLVIGWLLTDEDLRGRFMEQPRQTLADLRDQGYELTLEEVEAILLCDPTLWPSSADKIHPRLRRARLH
jgi:hypothetical protein